MKGLSIIIPCYNEESRGFFEKRIWDVKAYIETLNFPCEVIYVNDCSKDYTEQILLCEKVTYINNKRNRGRGYSFREGIKQATFDKILVMDADLSVPLENISLFYELCEPNIIVIGTRVYEEKRNCFRRFLTKLSKKLTRYLNVRDSQCGFKMFNKEDYNKVESYLCCNRWLGDTELLSYFKAIGVSTMESDVEWIDFPSSTLRSFTALISSGIEYLKMRSGVEKFEKRKNL